MGTLQRYSCGTGQLAPTAFGDPRVTHLLGNPETRAALFIDPVPGMLWRNLRRLGEPGRELETHVHVEHVGARGARPEPPALTKEQSLLLPRSWVGLREIRVGWNKAPGRVFSVLGVWLRLTRARCKAGEPENTCKRNPGW